MMKRRFGKASHLMLVLLICAAASEIGLRIFLGLGHPPLLHADPDYGYAFNANQDLRRFGRRVFYNEHGLRSEPLPAVKPAGEFRVLCVGDSVTNGGAMTDQADTYPYRLEGELRRAGIEARVLNASAGSWGVENELSWLRKRGLFESNVVILQVGTHDLAQRKSFGDKVGQDVNLPDKAPALATWELIERYGMARFSMFLRGPRKVSEPKEEDHRVCLRAIGEIVELVRSNHVTPMVLLMPDREELENPARSELWRRNLRVLMTEKAVPWVDMLGRFRSEPDLGLGAFRDGVHPNQRGNRLMAEAVAERILTLRATGLPGWTRP